jgi:hypothetical protein
MFDESGGSFKEFVGLIEMSRLGYYEQYSIKA